MLNINFNELYESEIQNPNPFNIKESTLILGDHRADFLVSQDCSAYEPVLRKKKKQYVLDYKNAANKEDTELYADVQKQISDICNTLNADDLIPKKHWRNLNEFIGSSLDIWGHPHLNYAFYKQLEIMSKIKRSKYLFVIPCSMNKPYSSTRRVQGYMKISNETGLFDVLVFSVIPVFLAPYDASTKYPFSCYSWDHGKTSVPLDNLKYYQSCRYFAEAMRMLNYEKIIFCHNGSLDDRIDILKNDWKFSENNIIDIIKIPEYANAHRFKFSTGELPEPKKFWRGCAKTRFLESSAVALFLCDFFGSDIYPYLKSRSEGLTQTEKEYSGYNADKMQSYLSAYRIQNVKKDSNDSNIELW